MLAKVRERYRIWRATAHASSRTPFPWFKVILLDLVLFASSISFQIVFPFIPFMVQDFFPELSREELGQQTGYIAGAFYIGNFIGSLVWGWISDMWGRRPVLIANTCGIALSLLIFGLSQNVAWAIAARLLWGLLDGSLGVCKTCIAEVCDNSNLAAGFSTIGMIGSTCQLLGSFAGGFLAQPARKYKTFQTSFFCEFPYLLPCLVGVFLSLVSAIATWLYLDETLAKDGDVRSERVGPSSDSEVELHLSGGARVGVDGDESGEVETESDVDSHLDPHSRSDEERYGDPHSRSDEESYGDPHSRSDEDSCYDPHDGRFDLDGSITDGIDSDSQLLQMASPQRKSLPARLLECLSPSKCWKDFRHILKYRVKSTIGGVLAIVACCRTCQSRGGACKWAGMKVIRRVKSLGSDARTFVTIMKDRTVSIPILLYGLLGVIAAIINDVFPLLMVTNYNHGGYKMDDNEISVILILLATVQMPFLVLIYPRIVRCFGYRKSFGLSSLVFAAACIVLPFSNRILGPIAGTEHDSNSTVIMNFTNSSILVPGSGNFSLLNTTNSTSCAGYLDAVDSVNENSVARIPIYVWLGLLAIIGLNVLARQTAFTSVMVMVGNSTRPETLGTVNGYAQALVAISRTIGPLCGALFFAWTEGNGLDWPLNFHFLFYICAGSMVLIDLLTFLLPKSIETKRALIPRTDDHIS